MNDFRYTITLKPQSYNQHFGLSKTFNLIGQSSHMTEKLILTLCSTTVTIPMKLWMLDLGFGCCYQFIVFNPSHWNGLRMNHKYPSQLWKQRLYFDISTMNTADNLSTTKGGSVPVLHSSGMFQRWIACQHGCNQSTVSRTKQVPSWSPTTRTSSNNDRPKLHLLECYGGEMMSSDNQGCPNRMTTSIDSCGLHIRSWGGVCRNVTQCIKTK